MMRTKDEVEFSARVVDRSTATADVAMREIAPSEADRRDKPRFAVSIGVTLLGDHNFYMGLTENISEGGIFVQTQRTVPIGTRISVEFSLPTSRDTIRVVGEVRWGRSPNAVRAEHDNFGSGGEEVKAGIGIQFTEMSDDAAKAIAKFITIRRPDFYAE
jgi:uncharacterized protein (TIGR02266 family)